MAEFYADFSKKTKAEWLAQVEKDLKGKPLGSLDWSPFEGLTMTPFFHPEDLPQAPPPLTNGRAGNTWEIGEQVIVTEVKTANQQALEALDGGVTAIGFVIKKEIPPSEMAALLQGIRQELVSTHFYFEKSLPQNFPAHFHQIILSKNEDPAKVKGSVNLAASGNLAAAVRSGRALLPQFRFLHVSGEVFYQKNNAPNELAQTIAAANDLLRQLTDDGLPLAAAADALQFSLAIGENYFLAIAKIRALKLLWENLAAAYGETSVACPPIEVHQAPGSQTNDPHTNKIRSTTQAMAAIIGGADRLYLLPSDAFATPQGTPFSRRIARNVQHILQLESYLDRVADPAAGSYFIENLTDALAERAWNTVTRTASP